MRKLALAILLLTAIGCGQKSDSEAPLYDTQSNPQSFPQQACDVLNQIEAGQLATYDMITDAFNQLYTAHPELLDNTTWRQIIDGLGPRFFRKAQTLVESGVSNFTQAAGFYTLASFAQPSNVQAAQMSHLFEAWTTGIEELSLQGLTRETLQTLAGAVSITRHFVLGDSLQQEFARQYLLKGLLQARLDAVSGQADSLKSLTLPDRAFLASLGMIDRPAVEPIAAFEEPPLQVMTSRCYMARSGNLELELYCLASAAISDSCRLVLKGADRDGGLVFVVPEPPFSAWKTNAITIIRHQISFFDTEHGLWIGLATQASPELAPRLAKLRGSADEYAPLKGTPRASLSGQNSPQR